MKKLPPLLFVGLGLVLFSVPAQAKRKHPSLPQEQADNATPAPEPRSAPAETAPRIDPEAAPSLSLGPFVDTHLGKILAPLDESAFAQPEVIAGIQASYPAGMAFTPANHKAAYLAAMSVCAALSNAMTERQDAVANLRGALATRSSEAQQPRGGEEAVTRAKAGDAFFLSSQKNNWNTRAAALRQNIAALYLRERQTEAQIGAWNPPPPAPSPTTAGVVTSLPAGAPTPSVSVPADDRTSGDDPVVGKWKWDGYLDVTLNADHTIGSKRHGTWQFTTAADGKRHYEFRYDKHLDWLDSLTLSYDGQFLEGANKYGKYVSAQRR